MLPSTPDHSDNGGRRQDIVRDAWKKLVECEERLTFWRRMNDRGVGVREVEHMGEDVREKYRSEEMKGGRSHREVIMLVMSLKLRDERKHKKELKERRNRERE